MRIKKINQLTAGMAVLAMIMILAGCGSTSVKRVDVDKTVDLSGRWNDTDSRLVSEEMIKDVMERHWIGTHRQENKGKNPSVIVGTVRNRSDEHINTQTFVKDLERSLINSGEVDLVADSGQREEVRTERLDQASHASEETAKEEGREIGADFMLQGVINTITDRVDGKQVKYYQVNLELINMENHKKVWLGEKKIKKVVEQKKNWL
ncbi:MAG: penicillin-binding protein activator LpoB [Proteobacteria bacterium]|nr:penicillin-binding protein activator LpoB [Pseudomonadota bacterium]MBU1582974.1 penicillin-binding protein activator LpoB [Pseudomonadota bacterium]MBU2452511.1 penicillin-binding protein activator LpoB [Pseudomonadota bacterium]MBU2631767.1 penicillin-binding protein activator LpoB [Pseudomonadota bacterium]